MSTEQLKEKIAWLTEQVGLVDFYLAEVGKIKKSDGNFIITDLDYTLFSRDEQIAWEPELKIKRWYEGNMHMINEIGIEPMIQKYYEGKAYPQDIVTELSSENSLILTAGIPEYQYGKRRAMKLWYIPMQVVADWEDKILETIKYILFELKYIPSEIIVYEDRPQYFIEYRDFLEEVLGCKITIMFVEMNGNIGYNKIEEI